MYKAILTTFPKILSKIARNVRKKQQKHKINSFSSKKLLRFKKFLGACSVQFWQPCQKFSRKIQKTLPQIPQTVIGLFFFSRRSCFSSSKSSGKMECKFDCLLNECLSNLWKPVSQSQKISMKKKIFSN